MSESAAMLVNAMLATGAVVLVLGLVWWFTRCPRTHRWDEPGGHCEECGACDEMYGRHERCRREKGKCD